MVAPASREASGPAPSPRPAPAPAAGRRLPGSQAIKLAFAALVFGAALWLLRDELKAASVAGILSAFRATPPWAIAASAAATVVSYVCLAISENWALVCVGRPLSPRKVGLVSSVSYALSNSLGFSVATGTASRVRFYRAWGLTGPEIAGVTLLAGTAVTLAGIVLAGLMLLVTPGLPKAAYLFAAPLLIAPVWLWIGRLPEAFAARHGLKIKTPPLPFRLFTLGGGLGDWACSGFALFVLSPSALAGDFPGFIVVFVLGSVVSGVSGVPGGIGVFEAVVLGLGSRFAAPHETVAALILYRLIYVLGPLSLTAAGLAAQQARSLAGRRAGARLRSAADGLAPPVMAVLAFAVGAGLLLAAANVPVRLPGSGPLLAEPPASRLVSSLVGALLILTAAALRRRQEAAYAFALVLLVAGAAHELARGFGLTAAAPLLLLAALLAPCRFAFDRRSAAFHDAASTAWVAAVALAGASVLWLTFVLRRGEPAAAEPWWRLFAASAGPLGVAAGLASLALLIAAWRMLGPSRPQALLPTAEELARAEEAIRQARAVACDAFLALMGDKALVFSPSGRSFVMYGAHGRRWIAMSDPVGPPEDRAAAIDAFLEAADSAQASPAFYAVQSSLSELLGAGFLVHKIGEGAVVPLSRFDLQGGRRDKLRHAYNHARKAGLAFAVLPAGGPETPWDELEAVSDAWLARHPGGEKSFSLGRFDRAYLARFPIAVLRGPGGIAAFANLFASPDRSRLSPDLMRHRPDAPHGVMDALFCELMLWARAEGYAEFELGMAPLAGLARSPVAASSRRLEAWIFDNAEALYGFKGLRAYKQKFDPEWRPMYLASPAGVNPLTVLADVALLTSGGAWAALRRPRGGGETEADA